MSQSDELSRAESSTSSEADIFDVIGDLDVGTAMIEALRQTNFDFDQLSQEADSTIVVIESCHSTWLFDKQNKRFRRILKATKIAQTISTQWRQYDRLVLDETADAFAVFLDESGSRLLRSRRHTNRGCMHCGREKHSRELIRD